MPAQPKDAQREVWVALRKHFDQSAEAVRPEQVSEMTGLDLVSVRNALRVLFHAGNIQGVEVEELPYPPRDRRRRLPGIDPNVG